MNQRHLAKAVTWLENASSSFSEKLVAKITAEENRVPVITGVFFTAVLLLLLFYKA